MSDSFHEYRHVRIVPGEPRLRLFYSDYFELFVWFDHAETPIAFRLCYDRGFAERAITWEQTTGFLRHDFVDEGGGAMESFRPSPILRANAPPVPGSVAERFDATPGEIPPAIRQLVVTRLTAADSRAKS